MNIVQNEDLVQFEEDLIYNFKYKQKELLRAKDPTIVGGIF